MDKITEFPKGIFLENVENEHADYIHDMILNYSSVEHKILEIKMGIRLTPKYNVLHRLWLKHRLRKMMKLRSRCIQWFIESFVLDMIQEYAKGYLRGKNDGKQK